MQPLKYLFLFFLGFALLVYGAKVPGCEQASQDYCMTKSHCPSDGKKQKLKDCFKSCCISAVAVAPVIAPYDNKAEAGPVREKIASERQERFLQFILQIEHP